MNENKPEQTEKKKVDIQRLPCRGCTKNCKNYAFCDGNPSRPQSAAENGVKLH
jgi:hypothetical protein